MGKKAAAYAKEMADSDANITAPGKAIAATESGVAGSFIQNPTTKPRENYTAEKASVPDMSRRKVLAFLSGTNAEGYGAASGSIVDSLKHMQNEMSAGLADTTKDEEDSIKAYEGLMTTKKKEVNALMAQTEVEIKWVDELGVIKAALAENEKVLLELEKGCATKTQGWEEIKKPEQKNCSHWQTRLEFSMMMMSWSCSKRHCRVPEQALWRLV